MSTQGTYTVSGMTCGHCVASVKEEVGRLDGVTAIDVDLVPGGQSIVRVASDAPLRIEQLGKAADEAGYELTGTTE